MSAIKEHLYYNCQFICSVTVYYVELFSKQVTAADNVTKYYRYMK